MKVRLDTRDNTKTLKDRFTQSTQLLSRFAVSISRFRRDLRRLFKNGNENPDDLQIYLKQRVLDFLGNLHGNAEESFQLIVEDGMASVGVDMARAGLPPDLVRKLYIDSPIFQSYKRMNKDMILQTNKIIYKNITGGKVDRAAIVKELQEVVGLSERRARTIARTETNVLFNQGRELGFNVMDPNQTFRYKWGGPYDRRTSDTCKWIMVQAGNGVTLDELKRITIEAQRKFHPKLTPRPFTGHPNCYVDGYRVLTEDGLKDMKDVTIGERVWSVNKKGKLELQKVTDTIQYDYIGPFITFRNKWFVSETTLDHPYMTRDYNGKLKKKKVESMNVCEKIPIGGFDWFGVDNDTINIRGSEFTTDDFATFMGWYLSEGSTEKHRPSVCIDQHKIKNIPEIKSLMKRMFGKLWKGEGKIRSPLKDHQGFYDYLCEFGHAHDKYIPKEIKNMSKDNIELFLDSYIKGDGNHRIRDRLVKGKNIKSESKMIFTSSTKMVSDLCELIYKIGKCPSIKMISPKGTVTAFKNGVYTSNYDVYSITIKNSKNTELVSFDKEIYFDEQKVYDLTIKKNHNMIVEYQGKFMLGSNCRHFIHKVRRERVAQ